MDLRKHLAEAFTIIIAAVLCAVIANAMASRERKLALVGAYPNAQKVPVRTMEPVTPAVTVSAPAPPPVATATTATIPPATTTVQKIAAPKPAPATTVPAVAPAVVAEDPLKRFPAHPEKTYVELHGDDVAWLHEHGALFLDARRTSVYEQGHIAGARTFSVWEADVDDKVNKLYEERNDPRAQLQPIVIYCSGGDCEDSHMLAQKLWGVQFNNLYVYKDGFPDWQKRGGPVKTGSAP
jgi:rhodanese-related sulfurtransferase